jgi:hypothetical protein
MTQVTKQTGRDKTAIRAFQVRVPEAELTELRKRIHATKWPEREKVNDASQGVRLATCPHRKRLGLIDRIQGRRLRETALIESLYAAFPGCPWINALGQVRREF